MQGDLDPLLLQLLDIENESDCIRWLGAVCAVFGAEVVALSPLEGPPLALGIAAVGRGEGNKEPEPYAERPSELERWMRQMREAPRGTPQFVPPHVTRETAMDIGAPDGATDAALNSYGVGVTFELSPRTWALLLRRSSDLGPFETWHGQALARVARFLKRALKIHQVYEMTEAFRQVVNRTRRAFYILDSEFRVIFANNVAADLLAAGDVLYLREGELRAISQSTQRRFREVQALALQEREYQSVVILPRSNDKSDLLATIAGISGSEKTLQLNESSPALMVRITRARPLATELGDPSHLESIFHLSSKEAQIVKELVAGLELKQIATNLSITYETARQYLKSIYSKTNVRRQRDLIHVVRMSLPFLGP